MPTKVLLDTDIGSDIDDAVCLAYLLAQPECELLGITTVSGEPVQRAMIASAVCTLAGQQIPIYPGAADPLLGKMIGGALVGTFLGVFVAYGMVGPTAGALGTLGQSRILYYRCIKVGILAFLNGAAPQVAVEFARKFLPHHVQPSFLELEEKLNALPSPG